jgi:hypothetical protein
MSAPRCKLIPDDIKREIASMARGFEFYNGAPGGNCIVRAIVGHAVLLACHLPSKLTAGAMLYRAGPHPDRDTMRFCLPDNTGGYLGGLLVGHVWNEVGSDLVDFSAGDWKPEADLICASGLDLSDGTLGPIQWQIEPPDFIWYDARTVKAGWRPYGGPEVVGSIWYGDWGAHRLPDYASFNAIVKQAKTHIKNWVSEAKLVERLHG